MSKLKYQAKIIGHLISEMGISPIKTFNALRGFPSYCVELMKLLSIKQSFKVKIFPCLTDRYDSAGSFPLHYFYQDLWAARKVFENNPEHHIDIGSRIDGFIAHVLSFRQVEVLDIRKIDSPVVGMTFRQADLMKNEAIPSEICDSISCLHALEHFGLGRYGDPLDPEGHVKGLRSLTKLLKPGGTLLLSVPIGEERIEFNAHRIFNPSTILNLLRDKFILISFSYVNDDKILFEDIELSRVPEVNYGCGLFHFIKR